MSYDHWRALITHAASHRLPAIMLVLGLLIIPLPLAADKPGRGLTAQFELDFLKFTIDRHFGALPMTELAAGTDAKRNAEVSPMEGTSPSPEYPTTEAKARLDNAARRNSHGANVITGVVRRHP